MSALVDNNGPLDGSDMDDEEQAPPAVVLVVDDEPDVRTLVMQRFRKKIKAKSIRFLFAGNGAEALDILQANTDVDMIVTDINMPVMDGLTLLANIKSQYPTVKAVIVSAYSDLKNIREAMNKGAYDFLTKPLDFRDFEMTLEKTMEHVRTIRANLMSLRENNIMRMFVDESALTFMLRKYSEDDLTRTEHVEASVVFIDICDFTVISEREQSDRVIRLLNTYFDEIVGKILDHRGSIDKFMGDCVMATFRGEGHRQLAALACLEVKEAVRSMQGTLQQQIGFSPDVSIGLNAGDVVYGPIGAKRVNRFDFTVIGNVVNTASRLQALAGPGEIIVTEEFASHIENEYMMHEYGWESLKGISKPIKLYSVVNLKD